MIISTSNEFERLMKMHALSWSKNLSEITKLLSKMHEKICVVVNSVNQVCDHGNELIDASVITKYLNYLLQFLN